MHTLLLTMRCPGILWILLLLSWNVQHTHTKGIHTSESTSDNAISERRNGRSGKSIDQVSDDLAPGGAGNQVPDVSRSWTKPQGYLPRRTPKWNPMLVKLMRTYLLSQKTSLPLKNSKSLRMFLKAFNQMTETSGGNITTKSKRHGAFVKYNKPFGIRKNMIKSEVDPMRHTAGRTKRYAYQSNDGMSLNNHFETVDDPFDANDQLVKWEHSQWLSPDQRSEDNHQYRRNDFLIPLDGPSRLTSSKQTVVRSDSFGFSGDFFTDNFYRRRRRRSLYDDDFSKSFYGRRDERYSSYPKYKDPFHPLADPMKDPSYRPGSKSHKSVLYPYDFTDFYEDPFYEKRTSSKRRGSSKRHRSKPKGKNFDFYQSFFGHTTSKKPNFYLPDYKDDGVTYPNSGNYDHSKGYNAQFGYSKLNFDNDAQDLDYNKLDYLPVFGGGGFVSGRSAGGGTNDAVGVAPAIDATAVAPAVEGTAAEPVAVDMEQVLPTTQTVTRPTTAQRAAPTTATTVLLTSPPSTPSTPSTTLIVPRTANPCDGLFTPSTSLPLATTRRPCYYLPRTTPPSTTPSTTDPPTTTPCYVTHFPGQSHPHYHSVTTTQHSYQSTLPDGLWSEFEIISSRNLWDGRSPRPPATDPPSRERSTRRFLITPAPSLSRYITDVPSQYDNHVPNHNIKQTENLDKHLYQPSKNKIPRITGTIELKYNKNKKPSFVVKLPFQTGKLPFAIRRLILSRFTEWPMKDGARNVAPVTMDPNCSPWNATCARPAALPPAGQQVVAEGENGLDIIAEVDPSLFDGQRLRQALLQASSRVKSPLDQEEMDQPRRKSADIPKGLGGVNEASRPSSADSSSMARPDARFLDWTAPTGGSREDGAAGTNLLQEGQGDTEWLELMSPSTAVPAWADTGPLPAETPVWLRDVIQRFTKSKTWKTGQEGGSPVGRLLPSQEPYELDNHIDLLPRAQTQKASSGADQRGSHRAMQLILPVILTLMTYLMQ